MKLSHKLSLIFFTLILLFTLIIIIGLPILFSTITENQMKKEAFTFGLFLQKNIYDITKNNKLNYSDNETEIEDKIYREFEKAISISLLSESFLVDEIILVNKNYIVEVGYPKNQIGNDYSKHLDIVENFISKKNNVVAEKVIVNNQSELDIDIVSYVEIDSKPRVLEIKLNFKKTMSLLKKQYRNFELISILLSFTIILIVMTLSIIIINKTAIKPVLNISNALEKVGSGNLDIYVESNSNDEFGLMGKRFNEMVNGLKEKTHLSKYVSSSTINAVKNAVKSGEYFHKPLRKEVTIFFSDIRSFTKYSEKRDPADIITVLNKILSVQANLIEKYNGYVDKFVGDETMAIFTDTKEAILCALRIQYNLLKNIQEIDGLKIGIGIYRGMVVEGDVGSNETKDYTVIGDSVNTASRLQSSALGGEIIIPEFIAKTPEIETEFKILFKGSIKLKGKESDMPLYKITGLKNID